MISRFVDRTSHLVDLEHAIIAEVDATAPVRQAEAGSVHDTHMRTEVALGLRPETLVAAPTDGAGEMSGWPVDDQGIDPHAPVCDEIGHVDRHGVLAGSRS